MTKEYTSLGLMSGTSMDGIDVSIIKSDGNSKYEVILDKYFPYNDEIIEKMQYIKGKITKSKDLDNFKEELSSIEKELTLFNAKAAIEAINKHKGHVQLIGYHGQTIFHNGDEKITRQLGDGALLSQLTKKKVIYDFRQNDLKNGGQGAPLTPIFHKLIEHKLNIKPTIFVNVGGIINITTIYSDGSLFATDTGPGMCLVDQWVKINSNKKYDVDGSLAELGIINTTILEQALENFSAPLYNLESKNKKIIRSFDTSDFNLSFIRGLSLEDGAATLIEFTVQTLLLNSNINKNKKIILCGGGRKNSFLVERIKKNNIKVELIDNFGINGDFVESQAFAYIAIRSILGLQISFPETTGCTKASSGGKIVEY
jgi:anhydro-N-acetylmuramic acid kinase|tara:strand:- start:287 stop:1396 length:1110 start_codon:yes stop_codon:yes gene_type:complete